MPILYVETNVLIAIATGRDQWSTTILDHPPDGFRIAIAGFCLFEALDWIEGETTRNNVFQNDLRRRIGELNRDLTSPHARQVRSHLEDAAFASNKLLKDVDDRLAAALLSLSTRAEILNLSPGTLLKSRQERLIAQPTDNLILHTVLEHASTDAEPIKVFLTENHRDFGGANVKASLRAVGVDYFRNAGMFLGWASSRGLPPGP